MRYSSIMLAGLFFFGACKSSKTATAPVKESGSSTVVVTTPAAKSAEPAEPTFVGNWKISALNIIKTVEPIPEEQKPFVQESIKKTRIMLNEDFSMYTESMEGPETGSWKADPDNKTVYIKKSGGTDTMKVTELTTKTIKGRMTTFNGDVFDVELSRE